MLSESGESMHPVLKAMKCWYEEKKLFIDQYSQKHVPSTTGISLYIQNIIGFFLF